jgi:antitoxin component YwqK of YwqJK toxin-antitoxin module
MKQLLLTTVGILLSTLFTHFSAQTVDSVVINGTQYYVYPYGQQATPSRTLSTAVSSFENETILAMIREAYPDASSAEVAEIMREYKRKIRNARISNRQITRRQLKIIRAHSDQFYSSKPFMDNDIPPSLDALPNGKYVQYFEQYYVLDPKGRSRLDPCKVAGLFALKNSKLDGTAVWFNPAGDSIKYGRFDNGSKEGPWTIAVFEKLDFYTTAAYEQFVASKPEYATFTSQFSKGVREGAYLGKEGNKITSRGFFKEGKPAGEWYVYDNDVLFSVRGIYDTIYLQRHFTYADQSKQIVAHNQLIRNKTFNQSVERMSFDLRQTLDLPMSPRDQPRVDFNELYKFNLQEEEDLELPEEKIQTYEGEDYESYNRQIGSVDREGMVWLGQQEVPKYKVIDSLGYKALYDGVYEEFYPSGQLKFRYIFQHGQLLREDTLFWDNGQAANVIVYDSIQQTYEERYFDRQGKLYEATVYDSAGKFKNLRLDPFQVKKTLIEGLPASKFSDEMFFEYDVFDTLYKPAIAPLTLLKSWYVDTSVWTHIQYDPATRIIQLGVNSINGTPKATGVYEFAEDFSNYRLGYTRRFKDLTLQRTANGSYNGRMADSIPQARIIPIDEVFDMTADDILYYKDQPFTGKFNFELDSKLRFSMSAKQISFGINTSERTHKKLYNAVLKYRKTGKTTSMADLLSLLENGFSYEYDIYELFPFIYPLIQSPEMGEYEAYDLDGTRYEKGLAKRVTGNIVAGKPDGPWKVYNTAGKLKGEYFFVNGVLSGDVKEYGYTFPANDFEYDPLTDTMPSKTVYHLQYFGQYKNGFPNGESTSYDWQGKITSREHYTEGLRDGESLERNRLACTMAGYEDGALDGTVQTYLTIPKKDSILLYDLNFQNGALQGESRSYHSNGSLSKRGFFLDGRPIDDYEAFDSLGTKFHYVKFLYSFPVEEKIWEENQLSVRYQFDWRDSIYFMPNDITETTSIEGILYDLGLMGDPEEAAPYLGRPSIVDKTGINYHMTKYYPNDSIARDGSLQAGKKTGCWYFYSYAGEKLYEVEYFDTILKINDSIRFKSKGILSDFDAAGNLRSRSYIIEKTEKYDCSHTDHYEVRQLYTIWEAHDSIQRMNGYAKNYYDNGTLQNEGQLKDGLPTGIWKFYDPYGKLNQVGEYVLGKRNGRWLHGDLSKTKYLGDICMNPNLPDLEERMAQQEKKLDIYIRYFKLGKVLKSEYYGLDLNKYEPVRKKDIPQATDGE